MELLTMLLLSLLLFFSASFLWYWKHKTPRAPLSIPILGHLHLFLREAPHAVLTKLARKYGSLMFLRFGTVQVVVASSKDIAKEFLRNHDAYFASRPPSSAGRLLTYGHADISFAPYCDRLKQLRRICTFELFTSKRIESFRTIRMEEVRALLSSCLEASNANSSVDIRTKLTELAFNLMTRMLMNKRFFGQHAEDEKEAEEFLQVMDGIFAVAGILPIGDYLPYLRWMDLDGTQARYRALHKKTDKFSGRIVLEREEMWKKQGPTDQDFLDVLLGFRAKGEAVLQGPTVKALLINLIAAGTDTSSVTIEWAMAELIKNPVCMERAREEINKVVPPTRLVEEGDIGSLPYLQAILKETFRLHPAVPLLLPHFAMESCEVMGNSIPAGTTVLINAYAIGRDPAIWKDPLEFRPERFLDSQIDVRGHDFEVIPFSSGRRICPGMSLAIFTVHLTVANLLHAFDWSPLPGESIQTRVENPGLTIRIAKKLEGFPKARLPAQAFL